MVTKLGFSQETVEADCRDFYLTYGTTLAGLVASGHSIDFDDWHAFVHHRLPYQDYLAPDPSLNELLKSIKIPKFIFTNADIKHAEICLEILGIRDLFESIICFESIMESAAENGMVHGGKPIICKPTRQAVELALEAAGGYDPEEVVFFDDSTRNITSSFRMGIYSVLVGPRRVDCISTLCIDSMHELPAAMPWLFESRKNGSSRSHILCVEDNSADSAQLN